MFDQKHFSRQHKQTTFVVIGALRVNTFHVTLACNVIIITIRGIRIQIFQTEDFTATRRNEELVLACDIQTFTNYSLFMVKECVSLSYAVTNRGSYMSAHVLLNISTS